MKYVVIVESCNCFKGSYTEYKEFNSLIEAWCFYKNFPAYCYAGNDYRLVEKPFIVFENDRNDQVNNHHHFYTPPRERKTKEHNYNKGYVYSKEFGCWINRNENVMETDTIYSEFFPSLFEELPF